MFGPDKQFAEKPYSVFVFGSNLAGLHSGGAAKTAANKYGAVLGQGFGLQSAFIEGTTIHSKPRSYAIPTLDHKMETLSLTEIAYWVDRFHDWVESEGTRYDEIFVTKIGCGIAGYTEGMIAPLFKRYHWPHNVVLPTGWTAEGK